MMGDEVKHATDIFQEKAANSVPHKWPHYLSIEAGLDNMVRCLSFCFIPTVSGSHVLSGLLESYVSRFPDSKSRGAELCHTHAPLSKLFLPSICIFPLSPSLDYYYFFKKK